MLIAVCFNLTVFSLFVALCVKPIYLNFLDFNMYGETPKNRLIVIMLNVLRCTHQLSAFLSPGKKTFFIPGIFAAANYLHSLSSDSTAHCKTWVQHFYPIFIRSTFLPCVFQTMNPQAKLYALIYLFQRAGPRWHSKENYARTIPNESCPMSYQMRN